MKALPFINPRMTGPSKARFHQQLLSGASWRRAGQSRWSAAARGGRGAASNTLTATPAAIPSPLRQLLLCSGSAFASIVQLHQKQKQTKKYRTTLSALHGKVQ